MATFNVVTNEKVANWPFYIRKLTCTGGATPQTYTHGEDRSPEIVLATIKKETPTVTTVSFEHASATTIKFDTLGDFADPIEVYLIWLTQASGGLNPP